MNVKRLVLALVAFAALALPAAADAEWRNYVGPEATFSQFGRTSGTSGYNYWTGNRVWRPIGHPFYLYHCNSSGCHYSASNSGSNPFSFPPYGYSYLGCVWEYYFDNALTVYPVTCQGYV
jgi:hypothetical protein